MANRQKVYAIVGNAYNDVEGVACDPDTGYIYPFNTLCHADKLRQYVGHENFAVLGPFDRLCIIKKASNNNDTSLETPFNELSAYERAKISETSAALEKDFDKTIVLSVQCRDYFQKVLWQPASDYRKIMSLGIQLLTKRIPISEPAPAHIGTRISPADAYLKAKSMIPGKTDDARRRRIVRAYLIAQKKLQA